MAEVVQLIADVELEAKKCLVGFHGHAHGRSLVVPERLLAELER